MVQSTNLENVGPNPYIHSGDSTSLLSKYDLPITHLDFSYVEKCTNGKELEQILHVLKSGQEGFYPELMKTVEEKLNILLPKSRWLTNLSKVIEQEDMGKNEWNEIVEDLNDWVGNISKDNKELESRKGGKNSSKPDIREIKIITDEQKIANKKSIKSTDYASWDKYDPDTELLKMDLAEEKNRKEAVDNVPKRKAKKQVKFNNFATEAEANFEANREREKGNECFKAGEYSSAVIHYTASLECKKTVQCFNNRSMTYIKKGQYQNAIDDCDSALVLEPNNFKANFRKAQALDHLKRFEEGLETIEKCITLDPNNTTVQEVADRLRKTCGVKLERKRFQIEDVHTETERRKGILKDSKQQHEKPDEKANSISKEDSEVLVPIPGTSRMPEPYFVTCDADDVPNVLYQIQSRSQILGVITLPEDEEEDCNVNHLKHICTRNKTENELNVRNTIKVPSSACQDEVNDDFGTITALSSLKKDTSVRTKIKKINKSVADGQQVIEFDDKDAGGEPYKKSNTMALPEDIHFPYTFLKIWTSVSHDTTLKKHAHIIKNMNMDQLVRVIGCKLDNGMFTTILRTLCMHFTVPGEVEKVYSVLVNVARLPRFEIISILMSEQDKNCVNMLVSFLHQHDKFLPEVVKRSFQLEKK